MPKPCAVVLALLAAAALPALAADPAPEAGVAQEVRYTFLFSGNRAGSASSRVLRDGDRVFLYEFNDRGRGPKTETRVRLGDGGIPVSERITGHDYWKTAVDERYERKGDQASWKSASEEGEKRLQGPAFYVGSSAPPLELGLLAAALLDAPGGKLPLLPDGEARIEKVGSRTVKGAGGPNTVDLYAVHGLGFSPTYVWLDSRRGLFAILSGWAVIVPEGAEGAVGELDRAQEEASAARLRELAAKIPHKPAGALAIRNARLFDPESGKSTPGTTVVMAGGRIQAVGRDGEVAVPQGAEVIDAGGKALLPGLWDMHTHLSDDDGILNLAAGVTTVRDMANDVDKLQDLRKRWASGEAIGPRVLMAGFLDGPGPYAGPTKALVSTEKEALDWVDRYAELGYVQIKLYSSLDPKLVPAIVKRAHEKGMRVSGHIPNGMIAEDAVRAGFDEIQHVNFLVLQFLGRSIDTRTPDRFKEPGAHAAELDLKSERVRSFLAFLKEHGTVSDPTLATFEEMYMTTPGKVDPTYAAVADRFPPQVRRAYIGGGLKAPEGQEQRYHDSYHNMENLVRAAHDAGVTIVAGTDTLCGFGLHRELELYVDAGMTPVDALRAATLVPARVMKRDKELGSVAPGKLADLILVDGDPAARISDIRRVVLTVKDGTVYDPAALYRAIGVKPVS